MLANVTLGSLLILVTVFIHTIGIGLLAHAMPHVVHWFRLHRDYFRQTVAVMAIVLGLFILHTIEIWLWAAAFVWVGAVGNFPDALYFSTVTFSTLGYGDIVAAPDWRLFAAFEAMDGFILLGWSISYLIAASMRHGPFRPGEHF